MFSFDQVHKDIYSKLWKVAKVNAVFTGIKLRSNWTTTYSVFISVSPAIKHKASGCDNAPCF